MKKLCMMAVLALAIGVQAQTPDPNFHIYLCFGQSNMDGNAKPEEIDMENVPERLQMMAAVDFNNPQRTQGQWYTAVPPLCREYSGLTPADWFGREMVANLPEDVKIGIVMVAVPGCKIEHLDKDYDPAQVSQEADWFQGIMKAYDNQPYQRLVELAREAQKSGVIKGMLLHQGCSNNGDEKWPEKVNKVYTDLLADLNLNAKDVPLLIGEVVTKDMGGVCGDMNRIIATVPYMIPTAHVISAEGLPQRGDGLHFIAHSYRELGQRYADAALALEGIENPVHPYTGQAPEVAEQPRRRPQGGGGFQMPKSDIGAINYLDIDYVGDGIEGHKLDIALPDSSATPHKVVVVIYGSAWFMDNAKAMAMMSLGQPLLDKGFAVVSINHRGSPAAKYPAQINDVKAAIRFIRANADKYGLDPSFIGITGFSSGGHLSALAGATNGVKEYTVGDVTLDIEGTLGDYAGTSSDVDAVVDWFGPIDMAHMTDDCSGYKDANSPEAVLLGCTPSEHPELVALMNPATYLDRNDPMFLVIHGDSDGTVPYCQSVNFADDIKAVNRLEEFITVPGGDHGPGTFNDATFARMANFFAGEASKKEHLSNMK